MKLRLSSPAAVELLTRGAVALAEMEHHGVRIDYDYLTDTVEEMQGQLEYLTTRLQKSKVWKEWRRVYGTKANLGSEKQLEHIMYDRLGFKATEQTATGRRATNKKALDKIDHPFVAAYQKVKQIRTTLTTFLLGPKKEMVRHDDGLWYVHPMYYLNTVCTYRSSCRNPNFQNVPARDLDMAQFVRRMYVPPPGYHFVEVDLAQIEVRVACCYTNDPVMMKYVKDPTTDMHRDVAMQIFFLTRGQIDQMKKTARHAAKNMFVFPEFYGQAFFRCAEDIWDEMTRKKWTLPDGTPLAEHLRRNGVTHLGNCDPHTIRETGTEKGSFVHHVKLLTEDFWERRFRVHSEWKRRTFAEYQRTGYIQMKTGFVITGEHDRNDVVNYPIQGPAFHCNLHAIIKLTDWLRKYKMKSFLVGEIHDSFQAAVHPKELQDFLTVSKHLLTEDLMRRWDWINVPLDCEAEVAPVDEAWSAKRVWMSDKSGYWSLKL